MKKITLILIAAILSSAAIFSQLLSKTDALRSYFENKTVVCDSAGTVVFHYKGGTVNRATDGGQTYEAILKNGGAFQDAVSYGALKEIVLNGKTVKGYGQTGGKQVEPLFKDQEQPRRTFASMARDSAGIKKQVDELKTGYDDTSDAITICWNYIFNLFEYMLWPILSVGFVALLWSMIAKLEHQHTGKWYDSVLLHMQRGASFALFIIVSIVASFYLLKWLFDASAWDMPVPAKVIIFYGIVWTIARLSSYVIPNAKPNSGGFFKSKGGGDEYERKQINNRN